jgi:coenzyme F420-reducing hydrogenase alpha subunit
LPGLPGLPGLQGSLGILSCNPKMRQLRKICRAAQNLQDHCAKFAGLAKMDYAIYWQFASLALGMIPAIC